MASDLEITNGHAARMRFSRFKQHMEGVPPTPRKPRSDARPPKKAKTEKNAKAVGKRAKAENSTMISESMDKQPATDLQDDISNGFNAKEEPFVKLDPFLESEPLIKPEPSIKPEPFVKEESMDDWLYTADEADPPVSGFSSVALTNSSTSQTQQSMMKPLATTEVPSSPMQATASPPALKPEPHTFVKIESMDGF